MHHATAATADRLQTVAEVAEFLAVHENTVYAYIAERGLPVTRIGRTVRVRPSELAAWLASQS
jgi:excisionase family DNA binding protein